MKESRLLFYSLIACIIVLMLVVFGNCIDSGFINWDDDKQITGNQFIKVLSLFNLEHLYQQAVTLPAVLFLLTGFIAEHFYSKESSAVFLQ